MKKGLQIYKKRHKARKFIKKGVERHPHFSALTLLAAASIFGILGHYLLNVSRAAPIATSIKSGNWSDSTTWENGFIPTPDSLVTIASNHEVIYDTPSGDVETLTIKPNAKLTFAPSHTAQLQSYGNVIVEGILRMQPSNPTINHTLRFVNIDETEFVGGGMTPLASDVGLWVMGAGKLELTGSPKTSWTRLSNAVDKDRASIELEAAPTGWLRDDELAIAPTLPAGTRFNTDWLTFDETRVNSVNSAIVSLKSPTKFAHPKVNDTWKAEVLNLTRNVMVEGTPSGRSHVFIHSSVPQSISHVGLRYMGPAFPRTQTETVAQGGEDPQAAKEEESSAVLGRYGLHFHHSMDGSRGTVVDSVVIRDTGAHAFVPHASHGITFRKTIAYKTFDDAYWWDVNNPPGSILGTENLMTHDTVFEDCVAAGTKSHDEGRRMSGFKLNRGINNTIQRCVGVGVEGSDFAAGFGWTANAHTPPNVWTFKDNIAHNNSRNGIFVWQNLTSGHVIDSFSAYNNGGMGIMHGAYINQYTYRNVTFYGNGSAGIEQHALGGINFQDTKFISGPTGIRLDIHVLPTTAPTKYRNCVFGPAIENKVVVDEKLNPGLYDFVNCGVEPQDFTIKNAILKCVANCNSDNPADKVWQGAKIRVQRANGTSYQMEMVDDGVGDIKNTTKAVITPIPIFDSGPGVDTIPPSVPTGLTTAVFQSPLRVRIEWKKSTDNTRVANYRLYRNGTLIHATNDDTYFDTNIQPGTAYQYQVSAVDTSVNESARSIASVVTTPGVAPPPPDGEPPPPVFDAEDINQDGNINIFDLSALLSKWNQNSNLGRADINQDGIVNVFDLSRLLSRWNP